MVKSLFILKIIFCILMGFIFLSSISVAITDEERKQIAELEYEQADYLYSQGNCRDASKHAFAAHQNFLILNDENGITKTKALIEKINDCLRLEGDAFYVNASILYGKGVAYLNLKDYEAAEAKLQEALNLSLEANISYSLMIPIDEELISKITDLYFNITEKIRQIQIHYVDEIYEKCEKAYFSKPKKLIEARNYCREALTKYQLLKYSEGIVKARLLLDKITDEIIKKRTYAENQFSLGKETYEKAKTIMDYIDALSYIRKAKDAFQSIEETPKVVECEHYEQLIFGSLAQKEEKLIQEAERYWDSSREYFLMEDLNRSLEYANYTCNIYRELKNLAEYLHDKPKVSLYKEKVKKCEEWINTVRDELSVAQIKKQADTYYQQAVIAFKNGEYENASKLLSKAWELYKKVEDWVGIDNTERLNRSIQERFEMMDIAKRYYDEAFSKYEVAEFNEALALLNKSMDIYASISRNKELKVCEDLLKKINEGIKKNKTATEKFKLAEIYYKEKKYKLAVDNAIEAKNLWKEINYAAGIEKVDNLLNRIYAARGGWSVLQMFTMLVPIIVAVLSIVFSIDWYMEKERRREEQLRRIAEERKRREEEKKRREEEIKAMRLKLKEEVRKEREKLSLEEFAKRRAYSIEDLTEESENEE